MLKSLLNKNINKIIKKIFFITLYKITFGPTGLCSLSESLSTAFTQAAGMPWEGNHILVG